MKSNKMKNMKKRIVALLLCMAMIMNGGISTFAEETNQPVHEHTEECITRVKTDKLICTKPEVEEAAAHKHTDDVCYEITNVKELNCGLEETDGHSHGDGCYTPEKNLICEVSEHEHEEGCYEVTESKTQTCELAEDETHTHDDSECYKVETKTELKCGKEDHKHSDACYVEENKLTCELAEVEAHVHGDGCYEVKEIKTQICELVEAEAHTHGDECYEWLEELKCEFKDANQDRTIDNPLCKCGNAECTCTTCEEGCTCTPEESVEEEELVTITEYEDDQVIIKVQAVDEEAEGIIPEGAKLQVTPITQENEKYEEVEEQIQDTVKDENYGITGFLAYDITFVDGEGNEVKPNGEILVSMSYKEAIVPETVDKEADSETDVTVLHFEEDENGEVAQIVDMGENEQLTSIQTTKDNEVEAAEFKTESFSIFTIVWKQEAIITAHCVDANGKSIGEENVEIRKIDVAGSEEIVIANLALNIIKETTNSPDDYEYVRAYLKKDNTEIAVEEIRYSEESKWQYKNNEEWVNIETGFELYLEYNIKQNLKVNRLPVVDTDDINISLFNYSDRINDGNTNGFKFARGSVATKEGKYTKFSGDQHIHQNYVCYNLYDGFPMLNGSYNETTAESTINKEFAKAQPTSKGESLNYLFSDGKHSGVTAYTGLSGLLQRNSEGYFYYDSHYNHAQYNAETQNIDIYDARLAHGTRAINAKGAQFLPFNNIETYATETNKKYNATYKNHVYQMTQGNEDLWFGMKIDASFYQPKDGKLGDEKAMVFEFSGDDDVWMFVDNVKVLDIGGIHSQTRGTVNFHTGEVYVYDDSSAGSDSATAPYRYTYKTTLLECFEKAYKEKNSACTAEELDTYLSQYFDKDKNGDFLPRFRDFTSHRMDFFYLERGWGSSNCKIQFNMPPLSEKSVTVEKQIANYEEGKYNDVEFSFKLYTKEDGEDDYTLAANSPYTLKTASGGLETKETDENGVFKLKHKEQAVFLGLIEGTKYYVEEIGVNSSKYDKVTINGVDQTTDTGEDASDGTFKSKELIVGQINQVTFINKCDTENLRHLVVKKLLPDGFTSDDDYQVKVTVAEQPYTGKYILRSGENTEEKTAVDGIITLKQNEEAEILGYITDVAADGTTKVGIPSGTSFKVEELTNEAVNEDRYYAPIYSINYADDIAKTDGFGGEGYNGHASGKLQLANDARVTITNKRRPIIEVTKDWDTTAAVADDTKVYVGLYSGAEVVTDDDGNGRYIELNKDNGYKAEFLQLDKEVEYSVKELRPVGESDKKPAPFTIEVKGVETGYVGADEKEIVTLNGINYRVTYPEVVQSENGLKQSVTITNTQLGSLKIIKVSTSDKSFKLEGAEFKIEKFNSDENKFEELVSGEGYTTNGEGEIFLENLETGKYQITETKAPTGYSLLAEPIEIEIGANGLYVIEKTIENIPLFELPSTGGHGTYWYTLGGFALMMSAVLSWYKNKRKEVLGE